MKLLKKLFLTIILFLFITISIFCLSGYSMYKKHIAEINLETKITEIYSNPSFTHIEDVPVYYKNAIVAVEDHRFYTHKVIDIIAIGRAIVSNIKSKDFVEGGSTITQQVAKNLYFIEENDVITRKFAEIFVGIDLEKNYSKDDILEIYMNTIYFGDGYYNIKDASFGYYNKEPRDLTLNEATMLAGIPNAPSVYSPTVNLDLAKKRQQKVISSMIKYGYIQSKEVDF